MSAHNALIKSDGIGAAVCNVTTYLVDFCLRLVGKTPLTITKIDAGAAYYPDVVKSCNYVDAQALDLIRQPWDANILVMENLFGDISPNLAGGLVGGMGMTA